MIIKEIRIGSFAGIENKIINFKKGVNVIYGDNEAGKTRIECFIKVMLYGFSTKRIKGENERKKYISFNKDTAYGEMIVSHNDRDYLIKRKFGSTKKYDSSEIFDFLSGEKINYINCEQPGRYFLGINRSTFEKTLYIGQLSVAFNKDKEEEIMDKITALFGCGENEVSGEKAMKKLDLLKKNYVTVRGGGLLNILEKKYNKLQEERYEGKMIAEKNLEWEKELIDMKKSKEKILCEIENLEAYKKYLKKVKLQKEYKEENSHYSRLLNEKQEREKELEHYKDVYEDKKSEFQKYKFVEIFGGNLKDRLLQIKYEQQSFNEKINSSKEISKIIEKEEKELYSKKAFFYKLSDNKNIADDIEKNLSSYELKLKELKEMAYLQDEPLDEEQKSKEKFKMISAFLILVLGIILFFVKGLNILIPILIIAVGGSIFAIVKAENNRLKNSRSMKIEKLTREIENIEKTLDEYKAELQLDNSEELIKYMKKYMMFKQYEEKMIVKIEEKKKILQNNNYEEIKKKYNKNNEMVKNLIKISNCKNINEVLDAADKYVIITSELDDIRKNIDDIKKVINNINIGIEDREYLLKKKLKIMEAEDKEVLDIDKSCAFESEEEIEKEEKAKSSQLIDCEKGIKDIENKINTRLIGKRNLVEIEEDIGEVSKKINNYRKNLKAINLAIEILQQSIEEVGRNIIPVLNNNIADIFSYLTEGKYNEVKLNSNYEMMVRGKYDLIKGTYLSNGTFDQLYLSLRIVLIEFLFKDDECSIILDDAFVQYDNKRRERALLLISERLKDQVLIFTCHTIERNIMLNNGVEFNYIVI